MRRLAGVSSTSHPSESSGTQYRDATMSGRSSETYLSGQINSIIHSLNETCGMLSLLNSLCSMLIFFLRKLVICILIYVYVIYLIQST